MAFLFKGPGSRLRNANGSYINAALRISHTVCLLVCLAACNSHPSRVSDAKDFDEMCMQQTFIAICDAYESEPVQRLLLTWDTDDPQSKSALDDVLAAHNAEIGLQINTVNTLSVRVDRAGFLALSELKNLIIEIDRPIYLQPDAENPTNPKQIEKEPAVKGKNQEKPSSPTINNTRQDETPNP